MAGTLSRRATSPSSNPVFHAPRCQSGSWTTTRPADSLRRWRKRPQRCGRAWRSRYHRRDHPCRAGRGWQTIEPRWRPARPRSGVKLEGRGSAGGLDERCDEPAPVPAAGRSGRPRARRRRLWSTCRRCRSTHRSLAGRRSLRMPESPLRGQWGSSRACATSRTSCCALSGSRLRSRWCEQVGDGGRFERMRRQRAQRERAAVDQLHRFVGTAAGRKAVLARAFAEQLPAERIRPRSASSCASSPPRLRRQGEHQATAGQRDDTDGDAECGQRRAATRAPGQDGPVGLRRHHRGVRLE